MQARAEFSNSVLSEENMGSLQEIMFGAFRMFSNVFKFNILNIYRFYVGTFQTSLLSRLSVPSLCVVFFNAHFESTQFLGRFDKDFNVL